MRSASVMRATVLAACLVFVVLVSLSVGAGGWSLDAVGRLVTGAGGDEPSDLIVRDLRLPRTAAGLLVGAAFGASGAVMQGVTRNPLAEPGLLGVSAGAATAVVMAISVGGVTTVPVLTWWAIVGAGSTAVAVYLVAARSGGATPVRLVLAGAAASALLLSAIRAVTLLDRDALDRYRVWAVGSLVGRDAAVVAQIAPFVVVGLVSAMLVAPRLDLLALGDQAATSLGLRVGATRAVAVASVATSTGAAVALAGPVAFVGLVVPHAVRMVAGAELRRAVPLSAVVGAVLVVACDVVGRLVAAPGEIRVGVVAAALGGPAFVVLVRRVVP